MPLKGVHCTLGYISIEEHRRCMIERPGPPCSISPTILELMTRPNMEREESGVVFSPSSLSSCQRQIVLTGRHDYYLDVKSGYKRIRGSIVHEGLSHEPPPPGTLGVVRELRMSAPISTRHGEQVFHGKPDEVVLLGVEKINPYAGVSFEDWPVGPQPLYTRLHVKITDFKTKDEVRHDLTSAEKDHVYQVNEYAWLVKQFLPGYLNAQLPVWGSAYMDTEHLFMSEGVTLPQIDEVVVDELSIQYMDMSRTRAFTSKGFLYDRGKMLSDYRSGRWVRRKPPEYEELELEPIHQFATPYLEAHIRKGIEDQIEAETVLAPPLTGEKARIMCTNCPVRQVCYDIGKQEGYSMEDQFPYINPHAGAGGFDEQEASPD